MKNIHPLDIVFRLAEDYGIVLLNGGGFEGPDWSVRVSFANLDDHVYDDIGRAVRAIARGYVQAYEASNRQEGGEPQGQAAMAPKAKEGQEAKGGAPCEVNESGPAEGRPSEQENAHDRH